MNAVRPQHDVGWRWLARIERALDRGITSQQLADAEAILTHPPDARQRELFRPDPLRERDARGDERAKRDTNSVAGGDIDRSGRGSSLGALDAGSTAAISGQLVGHEVTEQSGGHDGE